MAVILVPGFMLDADLGADVSYELEAFRPVLHVDPTRAESIEEMAAKGLADAPDTFALIGFSMGGYVTSEIQRRVPK